MFRVERNFSVPSCRNLLRKPLVIGVPASGLLVLVTAVLAIYLIAGGSARGNIASLAVGALGYVALRIFQRWAKTGWEEILLFKMERLLDRRKSPKCINLSPVDIPIVSPDTLNEAGLIAEKEVIAELLGNLKSSERKSWICRVGPEGAKLYELSSSGPFSSNGTAKELSSNLWDHSFRHYSLYRLPVKTDPLWLFSILTRLNGSFDVVFTAQAVESRLVKRKIELSRRANSGDGSRLSDIDADVTFEESSQVLQGLSRGDEKVVEISIGIVAPTPLELDGEFLCGERERELFTASFLGQRKRGFRTFWVTLPTAADLFPNILDPQESGVAILKTVRGAPLYFSPRDARLEALHWLVVGASGSGKSFFTGLVLKRMIEAGEPLSVLFVDHNRSFRRLVRKVGGSYVEPKTVQELESSRQTLFDALDRVGSISGVELSDLPFHEKKLGAQSLLAGIEDFLRARETTHPIYVCLDECWNFMRDDPVRVQRAFREFRKLNGAVVAITQSLSDFLTDESGQSIFQNAPIRVFLRQGEDVTRYQGILGFNEVELSQVKRLKQKKGHFSECLVQTPFLSRIGRLYPTNGEHDVLRTDNLREELIGEARAGLVQVTGVVPC